MKLQWKKREGSALSVPGKRSIHIHNDRLWQRCQPQTIQCHIYLSLEERYSWTAGAGDEWDIASVWYIFLIFKNKQYRRLKWISPAEGTQAAQITWQAGGNRQFLHIWKHLLQFITYHRSLGLIWPIFSSNDLGLTNIFRYYKREAGTQETLNRDLYENSVASKTTAVRLLLPRANQQMNW